MADVKPARQSKFNKVVANTIFSLAKAGKTNDEIAEIIGVSRSTIYVWKQRFPETLDSLNDAKEGIDDMVEVSLLKRALGYSAPEIKYFTDKGIVTDERTVIKHYPPDTTACIFWLKNRRPEDWRASVEPEHNAKPFEFASDPKKKE